MSTPPTCHLFGRAQGHLRDAVDHPKVAGRLPARRLQNGGGVGQPAAAPPKHTRPRRHERDGPPYLLCLHAISLVVQLRVILPSTSPLSRNQRDDMQVE